MSFLYATLEIKFLFFVTHLVELSLIFLNIQVCSNKNEVENNFKVRKSLGLSLGIWRIDDGRCTYLKLCGSINDALWDDEYRIVKR